MSEYLLLSRGQWDAGRSPEQIQGAIGAFCAGFDEQAAAGRLVTRERVLDGPFAEAKEIIGGHGFITASSLDEAARTASRNPCLAFGLREPAA